MRMTRPMQLFPIMISALFLFLAAQGTALAGPKVMDCFACHDRAAFQKKVKHQPAARGECSSCHSPHVARHSGMLQQQVQNLCYSCHPGAAVEHRQGIPHQPVRQGECLACHDPHGSDHAGLINKRSADNCFSCHSELPRKFKHTHAPYGKGQCSSCHEAHRADQPYLLVKEPKALCLSCHPLQAVRQKHPNYPAELDNCGSCHSPHGSDRRGLVRNVLHQPFASGCKDCHSGRGAAVTVDTCLECHPKVGEQMASSHNHLVGYGKNSCIACHSPHAGDKPRLLKGKERYVCGTCHEATFRRFESSRHKHTAAESCMDCHAPHGSNHPAMARGPVNTVCISCHKKHDQFTHPIGENVFDPRTGQMMTCASCHTSKGTDHQNHLRFSGTRDLCVQCHRSH
jgi:predicted CXXCH cytochrome family protein